MVGRRNFLSSIVGGAAGLALSPFEPSQSVVSEIPDLASANVSSIAYCSPLETIIKQLGKDPSSYLNYISFKNKLRFGEEDFSLANIDIWRNNIEKITEYYNISTKQFLEAVIIADISLDDKLQSFRYIPSADEQYNPYFIQLAERHGGPAEILALYRCCYSHWDWCRKRLLRSNWSDRFHYAFHEGYRKNRDPDLFFELLDQLSPDFPLSERMLVASQLENIQWIRGSMSLDSFLSEVWPRISRLKLFYYACRLFSVLNGDQKFDKSTQRLVSSKKEELWRMISNWSFADLPVYERNKGLAELISQYSYDFSDRVYDLIIKRITEYPTWGNLTFLLSVSRNSESQGKRFPSEAEFLALYKRGLWRGSEYPDKSDGYLKEGFRLGKQDPDITRQKVISFIKFTLLNALKSESLTFTEYKDALSYLRCILPYGEYDQLVISCVEKYYGRFK